MSFAAKITRLIEYHAQVLATEDADERTKSMPHDKLVLQLDVDLLILSSDYDCVNALSNSCNATLADQQPSFPVRETSWQKNSGGSTGIGQLCSRIGQFPYSPQDA